MPSECDKLGATEIAARLIKKHGARATDHAVKRLRQAKAAGDVEQQARYLQVLQILRRLLHTPSDKTEH